MKAYLRIFLLFAIIAVCSSNSVSDSEWISYKNTNNKQYPNTAAENTARYYYAVNIGRINSHNDRFSRNQESYALGPNKYTDLRFVEFAALFPLTQEIPSNAEAYTLPPMTTQATFSYLELFNISVPDQGIACNSGWAYAAATALTIWNGLLTGNPNPDALSAQNFIDCAGGSKTCSAQVPQVAFDYLTQHMQRVYPESDYPNNNQLIAQGMCILPASQLNGVMLSSYSTIANGNDVDLKSIVNNAAPVNIKFNPGTFEFMHYKEGLFTQPAPTQTASHYMTVVGFGTDVPSAKDYWIVQNSFGEGWGENGLIRIQTDAAKPITNSAIFPLS